MFRLLCFLVAVFGLLSITESVCTWRTYVNAKILGGQIVPASTAAACKNTCLLNGFCKAVDWDAKDSVCWLHGSQDDQLAAEGMTHYQYACNVEFHDPWTVSLTGCPCYFNVTNTDCACCTKGGCQCSLSNLHQCVECGHGEMCGKPGRKLPDIWTTTATGCTCYWDSSRDDCACCQPYACPCNQNHKNQCVTCDFAENCGKTP